MRSACDSRNRSLPAPRHGELISSVADDMHSVRFTCGTLSYAHKHGVNIRRICQSPRLVLGTMEANLTVTVTWSN